jgi:hypothetical protein
MDKRKMDESDENLRRSMKGKDISELWKAPFKKISKKEICDYLWDFSMDDPMLTLDSAKRSKMDKSEKIFNEFLEIINKYEIKKDVQNSIDYTRAKTYTTLNKLGMDYEAKFYYIRKLFIEISNYLRVLPKNSNVDWLGLSDILYFYSFTFTYFTNHNYSTVYSEKEANVRACDMPDPQRYIKSIRIFLILIL